GMAPKQKSPQKSWQQKSPDRKARSAAGSREETMKSDLCACAHHSTLHRVNFEDERSRNSRILLNAVTNMGEKLEAISDILTPTSLKTGWSTEINEGETMCKATAMLEHVLASCNKIHEALEVVRTELGRKDTEISNLRKDRLETELEHYQAMEKQHSSHAELLCKALESAKVDNKTLVLSLEEVLHVNNTLQSKLIQTQYELKSKETEHQQLILMEKAKTEEKMYTEQLESLKKQFQIEQEASRKAACQESAKKSLEQSTPKLAEVSHANRELPQKVIALERSLCSSKKKLISQRAQVRQCLACKANTERVKTESELRKMKAIKEKYQKNYEQVSFLDQFTEETDLEMQVLLKKQHEMQVQNRQLETQLEAERKQKQQLENKCQVNYYFYLETGKNKKKLKKASIESEQATIVSVRIIIKVTR
uniref:Uncharacterized protein n=1 Tax=Strix occidentalis caurina TaxID=311401 RepID=A0A8D0KUB0_STROC